MTTPSDALPATNPSNSSNAPPRDIRTWVILGIILGAIGMALGTVNVLSSALQSRDSALGTVRLAGSWTEKLGMPKTEKQRRLQAEYSERMVDAQWSLRAWRILNGGIDIVLSTGLVVGGVLLLKRRNAGRKIVRAAAWGHLPYEALAIALGVATSLKVASLQTELTMRMLEGGQRSEGADVAKRIVSMTTQFSQYMGMAMVVGIALGVLVLCVVLARMVDKPEVRAWCEA